MKPIRNVPKEIRQEIVDSIVESGELECYTFHKGKLYQIALFKRRQNEGMVYGKKKKWTTFYPTRTSIFTEIRKRLKRCG